MISSDKEITVQAIARFVGDPSENVSESRGVLPQQKLRIVVWIWEKHSFYQTLSQAEKIRWLQSLPQSNMKRQNYCLTQKDGRRVVAMVEAKVEDGINDAPVCLKTTILESFGLILLFQALIAVVMRVSWFFLWNITTHKKCSGSLWPQTRTSIEVQVRWFGWT